LALNISCSRFWKAPGRLSAAITADALVLCRDFQFPEQYREEINKSLSPLNLNLDSFETVDNSCPPHPALGAIDRLKGFIADLNPGPQSAKLPVLQATAL
jgi:hypothetical protein